VDALIDALRHDQPADLSIERSPGLTEVKVGPQAIARVDERRESLVVYAPADVRQRLEAEYPEARPDPSGVVFDLANPEHARAAVALLRRRATTERVAWQYRERSP